MIEIVPYRESWPDEFLEVGGALRSVLGDLALAIHHIGSTSVPGLAAKDIIDVQVTVAGFDEQLINHLREADFLQWRAAVDHCPPGMTLPDAELTKFMGAGPGRRAHIHMRALGKFNQRYPLLCRDYLRLHRSAADAYATIKFQLARYFPENVEAYYDIKDPVFDVIMTGAEEWSETVGWVQPPTDA